MERGREGEWEEGMKGWREGRREGGREGEREEGRTKGLANISLLWLLLQVLLESLHDVPNCWTVS